MSESNLKNSISPSGWWWLSFVEDEDTDDEVFFGACIVEGTRLIDAISRAWDLNINPGGRVCGIGINIELIDFIKSIYRDVFLPQQDCDELIRFLSGDFSVIH